MVKNSRLAEYEISGVTGSIEEDVDLLLIGITNCEFDLFHDDCFFLDEQEVNRHLKPSFEKLRMIKKINLGIGGDENIVLNFLESNVAFEFDITDDVVVDSHEPVRRNCQELLIRQADDIRQLVSHYFKFEID